MAIVSRTSVLPKSPQPIQKRQLAISGKKTILAVKKNYSLPTELSVPNNNLGAYSNLIYGPKKIGKTTLASQFADAVFFMFEPGAKALRIYRLDINCWDDALGYLTALEADYTAGKLRFKTVVMDTGFEAYQMCMAFVCKRLNILYPRENNFGADWNEIKEEFRSFCNRIFAMNLGFVVLCHQTTKENTTYTGNKYDQIMPKLSNAADDFFRAVIDNVMWYHYRGKERFLQIRGSDAAMAGVAVQADAFFKTPKGEPIFAIHIPSDPGRGYQAIAQAFANKQSQTFQEETEKISAQIVKTSVAEKIRKEAKRAAKAARGG